MERAEDGTIVGVQKDDEPDGVDLSYRNYESMLEKIDRLESWELALVALPRHEAVTRGEMETTSLAEMIAEFAPELRATPVPDRESGVAYDIRSADDAEEELRDLRHSGTS